MSLIVLINKSSASSHSNSLINITTIDCRMYHDAWCAPSSRSSGPRRKSVTAPWDSRAMNHLIQVVLSIYGRICQWNGEKRTQLEAPQPSALLRKSNASNALRVPDETISKPAPYDEDRSSHVSIWAFWVSDWSLSYVPRLQGVLQERQEQFDTRIIVPSYIARSLADTLTEPRIGSASLQGTPPNDRSNGRAESRLPGPSPASSELVYVVEIYPEGHQFRLLYSHQGGLAAAKDSRMCLATSVNVDRRIHVPSFGSGDTLAYLRHTRCRCTTWSLQRDEPASNNSQGARVVNGLPCYQVRILSLTYKQYRSTTFFEYGDGVRDNILLRKYAHTMAVAGSAIGKPSLSDSCGRAVEFTQNAWKMTPGCLVGWDAPAQQMRPTSWLAVDRNASVPNQHDAPHIIILSRLSFDLRQSAKLHLVYFSYTKKRRTPRRGVNWRRQCTGAAPQQQRKGGSVSEKWKLLSSLRSPLPLGSLGFVQQRGPGTPRRRRLLWDRVLNNVLTEPYGSWHRTMDLFGGVFAPQTLALRTKGLGIENRSAATVERRLARTKVLARDWTKTTVYDFSPVCHFRRSLTTASCCYHHTTPEQSRSHGSWTDDPTESAVEKGSDERPSVVSLSPLREETADIPRQGLHDRARTGAAFVRTDDFHYGILPCLCSALSAPVRSEDIQTGRTPKTTAGARTHVVVRPAPGAIIGPFALEGVYFDSVCAYIHGSNGTWPFGDRVHGKGCATIAQAFPAAQRHVVVDCALLMEAFSIRTMAQNLSRLNCGTEELSNHPQSVSHTEREEMQWRSTHTLENLPAGLVSASTSEAGVNGAWGVSNRLGYCQSTPRFPATPIFRARLIWTVTGRM
ncbi:hypothetical protein HER10_EVM0011972 [Colletotrichum scovillei]|uniref:uncharacterized protein n=1 Tax=Colletotrichum scovillei TaxID=1209932 RepID=UPI0015C3BAD3|nr:uncharacterized protein HER10_EVM0011972 [Colletotrichum scovillei]KAF4784751.1 hypothetical protein HER10_EVM0011972 [Colletotrichum scovillei]